MFIPRTPISQNEMEAPLPSRICASPSIEKCWNAITICKDLYGELKNNNKVHGYYFFVYEFDSKEFIKAPVFDYDTTNEMYNTKMTQGKLISVFYVHKNNLFNSFEYIESATIDEAIEAYYDYQKEEIERIEAIIENL